MTYLLAGLGLTVVALFLLIRERIRYPMQRRQGRHPLVPPHPQQGDWSKRRNHGRWN